jgi:hypothetical protein
MAATHLPIAEPPHFDHPQGKASMVRLNQANKAS